MSIYSMMASFNKEEAVFSFLKDHPDGKSVVMIGKEMGMNPQPVRRVIRKLLKSKRIKVRIIGITRVYNVI